MRTIPNRICVYPYDIELLTGHTIRQSRIIYNDAKAFFKKSKKEALTINELSGFLKIPIELIEPFIK